MFRKQLLIAAAVLCYGAFTSCGSSSSDSSSAAESTSLTAASTEDTSAAATENTQGQSQENTTESHNDQTAGSGNKKTITPESAKGGDIKGQWVPDSSITDLSSFVEFGDNGSGALYVDLSNFAVISDGKFSAMGMEASGEDLVIEKDIIKAYLNHFDEDSLILSLERIDGGDCTASIDGEYQLAGGRLKDMITAYIDGEFGGDAGDLPLTVVLENGSSLIKLEGVFSYTIENNRLELAVMSQLAEKFSALTSHNIYYSVEDDKVYFVTGEGDGTVMTRRAV